MRDQMTRLTRAALVAGVSGCLLLAGGSASASASPGHYRILIVHSTVGTVTGLKAAVAAFPDVSVVDDFDAQASPPPTAAQLEGYDMVVGVEDAPYQDLTD